MKPNAKSGIEIYNYLNENYILTEINDENAKSVVSENILMNEHLKEKLPPGLKPNPIVFFLENNGKGKKFYKEEIQKENIEIFGGKITRIFVGIDLSSGFYLVEGSILLWDEICAFKGLDEKDLQNFVVTSQYILALEKF